jgi:hypothetical protein
MFYISFFDTFSSSMCAAMPELLCSAKLAIEKGQSQGRDESYLKQLSDYIIPALVEALHKVVILSSSSVKDRLVFTCILIY